MKKFVAAMVVLSFASFSGNLVEANTLPPPKKPKVTCVNGTFSDGKGGCST